MISGWVRPCVFVMAFTSVAACAATGPFVWADSLPPSATGSTEGVIIQDGDTVNVRVFNQEPLSTHERVRSDGKISMPVIGEVMARGKRPAQLASEIQDRLKSVVVAPSVTVTLDAGAELKVSVLGEVKNAGVFQLDHGANVLHALAAAGGLSDYADADKVFVVRKSLPQRVRFRYQDLRSADPKSIAFTLQGGDVIVVE
ncbi:MAG: polysaccharide biosynthesis/export family protein [Labilithrix sp.]|nr:polysaccharide biosynthesis/export family protein [Labilithrix sp.]MBX3220758.1 polysaccharide biosynthesis/export family protein [Labilithrix sp.]